MTEVNPVAIETLFAAPQFSGAQISPDGQRVAYLAPWRGRLNVFVHDIAAKAPYAPDHDRRVTGDENRNLEGYVWSPDGASILYLQDADGDENFHLYRVDVTQDQPVPVDLTPFPGARVMGFTFPADDPATLLVTMNARDPAFADLHRLDLITGDLTMIGRNPGRFVHWIPVAKGMPHAMLIGAGGDYELARFEDGAFLTITTFAGEDYAFAPMPIMPTPDGAGLWIGSNRGSDRTRLVRIDLASGHEHEVDSHPVFSLDTPRPEADQRFAPALILNPVTGNLLGARYLGDRQVIHPLDGHFADVLKQLKVVSDADPGHISCDAKGRYWVVEFTNDRESGVTWFYDHATGKAQIIGRRRPELSAGQLAAVRPITLPSRDGLALPCHLTLPPERAGPHPTVLLVHGGPWYRDSASYDPEVQFFASRGYAVLQVNMRGSTGYGKAFMQAAKGELAGRMHDDLIDALDWAIGQGHADPDRVAIYGCSYGGYAALIGAGFTPDRFAAAIDYSGVADLRTLVRELPPFAREALVNNWIAYAGDPDIPAQNADMLARSPMSRLDQIRCPLLVIHGAQDVRVRLGQAEAVVNTLRNRGHEVEFLVNEKEGHWFINQDSNFQLYRTIEEFLARHLHNEPGIAS